MCYWRVFVKCLCCLCATVGVLYDPGQHPGHHLIPALHLWHFHAGDALALAIYLCALDSNFEQRAHFLMVLATAICKVSLWGVLTIGMEPVEDVT